MKMAEIDIADLVEAANFTKVVFGRIPECDHAKALKLLIDRAELVFGIYVEAGAVQSQIIKGVPLLQEISISGGRCVAYRSIHVRNAAEAEAMRQTFGDGARLH